MTDTNDGDALNRTILVRGFEGDERDLLRAVQGYGQVEDIKIKPLREEARRQCFDVGCFIGRPARFERGANRIPSGLKWSSAGRKAPARGEELTNAKLADALTRKTEFEQREWDSFGIDAPVRIETFIESGGSYFRPAGVSHSALSSAPSIMPTASLVWTSDLPGESRGEFPPVDPRAKEKALHCCESVLFENLSSEQCKELAEHCYVLRVLPGQELMVQDDDVNYVFILVSGVLRIFAKFPMEMRGAEGLYEDEVIVGAVSGTGQMLGEVDLLRKMRDPSHRQTISVSADVHSIVIAVPAEGIVQVYEAGGWSTEDAAARLQELETEREDICSQLTTSKLKEMSNFTKLMNGDEMLYLADVCGSQTYEEGTELQNLSEYANSVAAILLSGQVELVKRKGELKEESPDLPSSPSDFSSASLKSGNGSPTSPAGSSHVGKPPIKASVKTVVPIPTIMVPGEMLQESTNDACSKWELGSNFALITRSEVTILFVNYEDLRPVFSVSFALRKYAEDNGITNPYDFPKCGNVSFSTRHLLANINDLPNELRRFPWWRSQERRLLNLARAKRRGREDWRCQLEEEELGELDETGTYVITKFDSPATSAPFYWNKTSIPTATSDFRIHDTSLSDLEVSILFSNVREASFAVQELEKQWKNTFASAKAAGQSAGYKALLQDFLVQLRKCRDDYSAAEQVEVDFQKRGVFADASILREFVVIYNKSKPIQLEKAVATLRQLLEMTFDENTQFLLIESAHLWCSMGFTSVTESLVEVCEETAISVPTLVYTSIVMGWIRLRNIENATEAMVKMVKLGVTPDIEIFNALLILNISLGLEETAVSILDELESAAANGSLQPNRKTYVIAISGIVRHGDGPRVENSANFFKMIRRMLQNTPEPVDAPCLNLVVEAWCIAGDMKNAKRALQSMCSDLGCECDEQVRFICDDTSRVREVDRDDTESQESGIAKQRKTFAILAAGWARAGKARVASDMLLSLANKAFDSSKIDLNAIVFDWAKKKWRRVKGFDFTLPTVVKQQLPPTLEAETTLGDVKRVNSGSSVAKQKAEHGTGRSRSPTGSTSSGQNSPSRPGTACSPSRNRPAGQDSPGRSKDLWEKRIDNELRYQQGEPAH